MDETIDPSTRHFVRQRPEDGIIRAAVKTIGIHGELVRGVAVEATRKAIGGEIAERARGAL